MMKIRRRDADAGTNLLCSIEIEEKALPNLHTMTSNSELLGSQTTTTTSTFDPDVYPGALTCRDQRCPWSDVVRAAGLPFP